MNYPNVAPAYQLTIDKLLLRSLQWAKNQKIVYRDSMEYTYADFHKRVQQQANMLKSLGVEKGDTVAFMDWDSHRYLEAYFAVPMLGAVLHTINIRLSPEQLLYTINHAEDAVLFVHRDFIPMIEAVSPNFETVKTIVVIDDGNPDYQTKFENAGGYEKLLSTQPDSFDFPELDENTVATTFYTTGTTGNPKGVYFTHRQLVLHTMAGASLFGNFTDPVSFTHRDVYMPLTPMFHVHAWGVPYIATMMGVKQVYPGRYEPEMLLKLLLGHKVTFSHCVPTILQMILSSPATQKMDFSGWKVIIGGSALSKGLAKMALAKNINLTTGYGMSETCPILTVAHQQVGDIDLKNDDLVDVITSTGFQVPLVDLRIHNQQGTELPAGKRNTGEIVVRAPWLTSGYFKLNQQSKELWKDGWLHTGDIAYKDEKGYVHITDRLKDVIKTGGEWVSSLELESIISQCDEISDVAVIGIPDEKWGERPIAYVVLNEEHKNKANSESCKQKLQTFVQAGVIEKWAIPDKFIFIDEVPKTSVGKHDKKLLRKNHE